MPGLQLWKSTRLDSRRKSHWVRIKVFGGWKLAREESECGGRAASRNSQIAAKSSQSVLAINFQNVVSPSIHVFCPGSSHCKNRRRRTLLTSPSIRKNERMLEPP